VYLETPFGPQQGGEERASSGRSSLAENLLLSLCDRCSYLVFHHNEFTLKLRKLISFARDMVLDILWENFGNEKELRVLKNNEMKRMAKSQRLVILYHRSFTVLVFYFGKTRNKKTHFKVTVSLCLELRTGC